MNSAGNPTPDARKRTEQLERSREWLKRYFEARAARQAEQAKEPAE